jgi:hypothetical protein
MEKQQPHWKDKNWEYQPSTSHNDSSEFRKRMELRRKAVQQQAAQQPQPVTLITENQ